MNAVVSVIGNGRLVDCVCSILSEACVIVRRADFTKPLPDAPLTLVLSDEWHPALHQRAEEALGSGGAWLRGFTSLGYGVIGPLVQPGQPGCSRCADTRRVMGSADRNQLFRLYDAVAATGEPRPDAWASRFGTLHAARMIAEETGKYLRGSRSLLEEHVYYVHLKTLQTSRHFVLPVPECPICALLPDDSPTTASISLTPSPKVDVDSYRCRSTRSLEAVLVRDYLDDRTGLLNQEMHDMGTTFAAVSVNLPLLQGDEGTAGRALSYTESTLTAILEGLERSCGLTPKGKRVVVHESFNHLRGIALDPVAVGVHANEQYARKDFPFQRFDPRRPIDWVWGYSFLHRRPILVPKLLAYYSLGGGQGYVYETSNGCAIGGSLEEAIFHGVMEVVERDSFLLTWYAELPLPRLDLESAKDAELSLMVDRVQSLTGYDLLFYDTTMENQIPSVWAIAKNRRSHGVNLICAGGAHLDPIRAVKGAIHELAGMLQTFDERFEANRQACLQMYHDPNQVREMEDHSLLYSLPEAEERFAFLLDERRPTRTFSEAFKRRVKHADLTDDLLDVLTVFKALNLEVIVVDQTTAEVRRNGLHCVKVLIPGMLPITFGYHLTRLEGLERVLRVPMELGYRSGPLARHQLNPHPHPFP